LEESVRLGLDGGPRNLMIASSRGVTYASRDAGDFAEAARTAAARLRDHINAALAREGADWC
jgi:CO/xanthine dehydrogenase Mo-binding subunit